MARSRQREIVLGVLALSLAGLIVWRLQTPAAPAAAATGVPAGSVAGTAPKSAVEEVNIAALDRARPEPENGSRNPFRFRQQAGPERPAQTPGYAPRPSSDAAPAIEAQTAAPRIPLKFIGRVDTPGGAYAVLSDGRGVYQGRTGEVVEGRYRIVSIGVESVELAYLDGRGRQTIAKTGQ